MKVTNSLNTIPYPNQPEYQVITMKILILGSSRISNLLISSKRPVTQWCTPLRALFLIRVLEIRVLLRIFRWFNRGNLIIPHHHSNHPTTHLPYDQVKKSRSLREPYRKNHYKRRILMMLISKILMTLTMMTQNSMEMMT